MQQTIDKLQKAIDDKKMNIALVHTRLLNRTQRDGVELCRDELETKLFNESTELDNNVHSLQEMMADSLVCLRHLKQSIVRIDIQLKMKHNSLRIDGEMCAEQRKRVDYRTF